MEPKIIEGIKIGKVSFCCCQLAIELTQIKSVWAESQVRTIIFQEYSCSCMIFCPCRMDQLFVQWPVDDPNLHFFNHLCSEHNASFRISVNIFKKRETNSLFLIIQGFQKKNRPKIFHATVPLNTDLG